MELAYIVTAEKIIKDAQSSKYSLVDIFSIAFVPENNNPPRFFAIHGRILSVPNGPATILINIEHEDGTVIDSTTLTGTTSEGDLDIVAYFGPTVIQKSGKYFYRITYNDEKLNDGNKFYFVAQQPAE